MRRITIISLLALALFSCKKEPVPQTDPPVITFAPQVETKSFITSAADQEFKKGFAVFAAKTERVAPHKKKEIMVNTKVSNTTGLWSYSPELWWGLNCDHDFLAIYPWAEATATSYYTFDGTQEVLSMKNVRTRDNSIGTNIGKDIMYARHHQYFHFGDVPDPISLHFQHCMCAFSVQVRNASETDITDIEGITLEGLLTTAKELTILRNVDSDPTMTLDETSAGTYQFPTKAGAGTSPWIPAVDNDFKQLIEPSIILPQNFLNKEVWLKLQVRFKGQDNLKNLHYKLSSIPLAGPVKDQYDYLPGKHYVYKIDVLSNRINCSVEVKDWINDPVIELK